MEDAHGDPEITLREREREREYDCSIEFDSSFEIPSRFPIPPIPSHLRGNVQRDDYKI